MKKIHPGYLAQQAADRMWDMIRRGGLNTGDRIIEESMCTAMGVSRTPLREALRILSSEGLIESMQENRDLQRAFRQRDPDGAEASMRTHLTRQFEALRNVLTEASGRRGAGDRRRSRMRGGKEVSRSNG